jgi:transposase InsO family protein
MQKGFLYLTAVIEWYSRYVLSWRLSNSMDGSFCREALLEALDSYGTPEIFNTDCHGYVAAHSLQVHSSRVFSYRRGSRVINMVLWHNNRKPHQALKYNTPRTIFESRRTGLLLKQ